MILHIFSNTGSYPTEFANFTATLRNEQEHILVFRNWKEPNGLSAETLSRTLQITSKKKLLFELTPLLKRADRVIFHSFTIGIALFYWIFAIRLIRSSWIVLYGSELYWRRYAAHTLWNSLQERMRKVIFSRIGHAITPIERDFNLFRSNYSPGVKHLSAIIPLPGNMSDVKFIPARENPGTLLNVLLGNSSTDTNNHREILLQLSELSISKRMKLICPLSYGDATYADEISALGKSLFGERFVSLRKFLPKDEYLEFLSTMDLAVMNHDRQQAVGNINTLLLAGKKVFIKRDNPANDFYKLKGFILGETEALGPETDLSDLLLEQKDALKNHQKMKELLSDEHFHQMWEPALVVKNA